MFYYTLSAAATSEHVVERSRFLGYAKPVSSEEEAQEFIKEIKARHHDAKHNCFAYIIRNQTKRYSDDGEPSGTAGVPMLDLLEKSGLQDVVVVVTRYFGGVLLGTGGLVRAYSAATKLAVESAGICKMTEAREYTLQCAYGEYDRLLRFLSDSSCTVTESDFAGDITVNFRIPAEISEGIEDKLSNAFAGKITATFVGASFVKVTGLEPNKV